MTYRRRCCIDADAEGVASATDRTATVSGILHPGGLGPDAVAARPLDGRAG